MAAAADLLEVECVEVRGVGEVAVVTPTRDLGEFGFEQLRREAVGLLQSLEKRTAVSAVVIDFGRTDYIGSSALGLLLKLWTAVRQRDGRMALCNVSGHEREILHLTKLDTLWPVHASRDAALNSMVPTAQPATNLKVMP